MESERIDKLMDQFFLKTLSLEEQKEFEDLLKSSREYQLALRQRYFTEKTLEILELDQTTDYSSFYEEKKIANKKKLHPHFLKYAAMLLIPLLSTLLFFFLGEKDLSITKAPDLITYYNNESKSMLLTLPDNSQVRLFAHSEISYPSFFNRKERYVKLIGEATFDVIANIERPFIVESVDGTLIKALGTKFYVSGYNSNNIIEVYLERGRVNFGSKAMDFSQDMKPSDLLTLDKENNTIEISSNDGERFKAYEQDILLFRSEPIYDMMTRLSHVYNTNIIIKDKKIGQYQITASFKNKTLDQIMDILALSTPGLKWKQEKNSIIIYK